MKDLKTEQYLTNGAYQFVFVKDMPINTIDLADAKGNPARLSRRLDDDRVTNYGVAMLDGADFPAIVVFNDQPKKRLVTGLHRITAAIDADRKSFDAYVVTEADEYRRVVLTRSINSIEGKAPDHRENLGQALEILRQFPGATVKDVAAALNVKPEAINAYRVQVALEERALHLGVGEELTTQAAHVKLELSRIPSDATFVSTVKALSTMKARGAAAIELVKTVRNQRSEDAASKVIGTRLSEWREEQSKAQARYGKTPTAISTRFMGTVRSLIRETNLNKLALTGIQPYKLPGEIQAVEQAIDFLQRVLANLKQRHADIEKAQPSWTKNHGSAQSDTASPPR